MALNRSKTDVFFERIPPFLTWVFITFPIWSGFFFPDFTAYVILFLNVYFLYKSISLAVALFIAIIRLRKNEAVNWLRQLQSLDNIPDAIDNLEAKRVEIEKLDPMKLIDDLANTSSKIKNQYLKSLYKLPNFIRQIIGKYEKSKALQFIDKGIESLKLLIGNKVKFDWHEMRHVVLIPHWKEPFHILESTINQIKNSNFPTKRITIVLGAEARDPEGIAISKQLQTQFGADFEHIWVSEHTLTEDEIIGKSSNMCAASKCAYSHAVELGWDIKKVTVTSCDADSILPLDYFSNLTYLYITQKDAEFKFYAGAILLYANIWRLPFFARVKNSMSTLYNLIKLVRTDKFVPFSTYTLSLWMVKEIDFWSPDITPEDFHTFFKSLFKYPNKVETIPIYQRVMSDAAEGTGPIDTALNNYLQERRWAWGVSDDGWMIRNVLKQFRLGRLTLRMFYLALHTIWDHLTIGVAILITYGGNIVVLVNPRFNFTPLGANLARISSFLIQLTLISFIFTILMDQYIKPKPIKKRNILTAILGFAEWFLQPIIGIILITIPGIEAHTRLLFGKYLEYYLTKKK